MHTLPVISKSDSNPTLRHLNVLCMEPDNET